MTVAVLDRENELEDLVRRFGEFHVVAQSTMQRALATKQWACGAALCLDMLHDPVSRRWSTDEEWEDLQALWSLFNRLQSDSNQPQVKWDYGQWVTVDGGVPVMEGPWTLVGWGVGPA